MKIEKTVLRGAGCLYSTDLRHDKRQAAIAHDFLEKMIKNLCRNSAIYYRNSPSWERDYPLRFPERSIYSHFGAAIHDLTLVHLSEVSITRKSHGKVATPGRVDIWACYRDCDVFVELKRCCFGWKSGVPVESIRKNWGRVCKQAATLKKQVREWGGSRNVIAGFQIALPYSLHKPSDLRMPKRAPASMDGKSLKIEYDRKLLAMEFLEAMIRGEKSNSAGLDGLSMSVVWVPPSDMCAFETEDDRLEYNPYVAFNVHLVPAHKRSGRNS